MQHGLMNGMFWAGMLIAGVPLLLGIGVAVLLLVRRGRARREVHSRRFSVDNAPDH
ncbi:MAG: hypothetical protein HY561_01275 [Gemmatimonadetes bacterium]|nr:hypothetical protein [Gemmatimonadota bacterium]